MLNSQVIRAKEQLDTNDSKFDKANIVLSLGETKLDTMVVVGKLVQSSSNGGNFVMTIEDSTGTIDFLMTKTADQDVPDCIKDVKIE